MALFKRGNVWWVRFTDPGGREVRRSAQTRNRKEAQEYHDRLRASLWRQAKLGERPRRLWQDAVERWCAERAYNASLPDDVSHLRWLHPHLYDRHLDEIDRDVIDDVRLARIAQGRANATVNRTLQVIRGILRTAMREWGWLDAAPYVRMMPEQTRRVRWLSREEADQLLAALPVHIAEMMRFTLATGLRERNVTHLEWSQVDFGRRTAWIHPDQAKARKAIAVPLNADAMLVLRRQQGTHPVRVFTYQRRPVSKANTKAWKRALADARITDFRWHDLRHTWASWHVQGGTPLYALQELGGWSTVQMVQRSAHLSAEHLAEYTDRLARPRTISGTVGRENASVVSSRRS